MEVDSPSPYKSFINGTIPELNGMRCYAVMLVLLHHLYIDNSILFNWFNTYGWYGVNFFFTLSGFLITGLLLKELNQNSFIVLKAFWMRRIFRLWPAFYTCLFFGSIVIFSVSINRPEIRTEFYHNFLYYPFALANYLEIYIKKQGFPVVLNHFWSLAVEEHFYLIWPIVFSSISRRKKTFWVITLILLILPIFLRYHYIGDGKARLQLLKTFFSTETNIDSMLFGCLTALIYSRFSIFKNISVKYFLQIASITLLYYSLSVLGPRENLGSLLALQPILLSIASSLAILGSIENKNKINQLIFNNKAALYLGKISYSLYLTHHILYTFNYGVLSKLNIHFSTPYPTIVIQVTTSIIVSHFLFTFIEKPFFKFRLKFSRVH